MRSTSSTVGSQIDGELDAGIGAREARHDLRQVAVGVVVGHAQAHAAGELGVGKGGERLDVELDDAARVVEQPLAVLGELGGAAVAREDRLAEPLLEPLHLHRHGRLGLVHDVGGAGEAAGLGNGDEGAQLVDVDERGHGSLMARHPGMIRAVIYHHPMIGCIINIRFTYQYRPPILAPSDKSGGQTGWPAHVAGGQGIACPLEDCHDLRSQTFPTPSPPGERG